MNETMREVLAAFERERAAFLKLIETLAAADWDRPTPDNETWAVKDTLAHLASTDRSMGSLVKGIVEGTYSVEQAKQFSLDDYNARQVARGRETPVDDLRRQLVDNRAAFLDLVRQIPDGAWAQDVWSPGFSGAPGKAMPLRDRLLDYAAHDSEHAAHIRAAIVR